MSLRRLLAEGDARWSELEALLGRAQRGGPRSLTGEQVRRLAALYRSTAADLAAARAETGAEDVARRLNRLCAASHGLLYGAGARRRGGGVLAFFLHGFPREVRATLRWHLASTALFVLGALASWLVLRGDPDLAQRTLGEGMVVRAERCAAQPDGARRYLEVSASLSPFLSWGIMVNNIGVTLLAFGAGASTVVLGALLLLFNGVSIGGAFALFEQHGVAGVLGTFIAAHGPIELLAIFLAGGAGMSVGAAWVFPGRRGRVAALRDASAGALRILLGTTVLLIVAGLLEGFLSPSTAPLAVKIAAGAVTLALALLLLLRGGRDGGAAPERADRS